MANTRRSARISATAGQDENQLGAATTMSRVTRAKANATDTASIVAGARAALAAKQHNTGVAPTASAVATRTRKRAALGDVSNVHKDSETGGMKEKGLVTKVVKTTVSSTVSKARASARANAEAAEKEAATAAAHRTTRLVSKRDVGTTTTAAHARRRAPLKPLSSAAVAARTGSAPKARPTVVSHMPKDSLNDEELSDGNKENETPPAEQTDRTSTSDDLEFVEALEQPAEVTTTTATKSPESSGVQDWDDLDADEMDDPTMVAEYVTEIFEYMRELEIKTMPDARYMDQQPDLKWQMRDILIDWLVEVHTKFRLLPETLFVAVNLVDRFLSLRVVNLEKLQLVGITGMFIAAKYEEVFSPSIQNFVYIADNGYTEDDLIRAETFMLQVLEFNLSYPNPLNFLRRISKADNYDIQTRTVAKYLLEISLLDHRFMTRVPSIAAAASMFLARLMLERPEWDKNLVHYSGYTEAEIKPVADLMIDYLVKPVKHEAFFKKYASKRYMKASIIARQWAKKYVDENPLPAMNIDSETAEEE
ncbi:cyclin-like protein [Limtongia smithiae]|uniref:cyclin-like protein n=1 Tax=Limtongia smithiae TaxID=1125753 RepID=UPI0034CF51B5